VELYLHPPYAFILGTVTFLPLCSGAKAPPMGAPAPLNIQNQKLKNTNFEDVIISNVLLDLPFSQNQPLKSADD
jgi:hypothetical protein